MYSDCSDSYLLQTGGVIEFNTDATTLPQWYDCVWTIKRHITNFPDAVIVRMDEVNLGKGKVHTVLDCYLYENHDSDLS